VEQADVKILIIDDVNAVRIQLRDLLRTFGFKNVKLAANAQEAKAALESEPFHLVLCDWHMTPVTGFEFLTFVRQHPAFGKIPFIMVTAETTREMVLDAIKSGVDDYIIKPLTLNHMSKVYSVLLKRQVL
jgi:two-component system chemotaxis response regulator CheY